MTWLKGTSRRERIRHDALTDMVLSGDLLEKALARLRTVPEDEILSDALREIIATLRVAKLHLAWRCWRKFP